MDGILFNQGINWHGYIMLLHLAQIFAYGLAQFSSIEIIGVCNPMHIPEMCQARCSRMTDIMGSTDTCAL